MLNHEIVNLNRKWVAVINVILLVWIGLVGKISIVSLEVIADNEPNDTFNDAQIIIPGEYEGSVGESDTMDYYKLELESGTILTITYTSESLWDQTLKLYDPNKEQMLWIYSSISSEETKKYYLANESENGYWYLKVEAEGPNSEGDYIFNIALDKQNDSGENCDISESFDTALAIDPNKEITGYLADLDIKDMYKMHVKSSSIVEITFSSDAIYDQELVMYNPNKDNVLTLNSSKNYEDSDRYYFSNETEPRYWYLGISMIAHPSGYFAGEYKFNISINENYDANNKKDVAEDFENALRINIGIEISGHLEDMDIKDMYKVYLASSWIVTISFSSNANEDQELVLYNPRNEVIISLYSYNDSLTNQNYSLDNETVGDYWFICLSMYDHPGGFCPGDYTFTITTKQQNDGGSGTDVANDLENAFTILPDINISGYLQDLDKKDMYKIFLAGGQDIFITFSSDAIKEQELIFYNLKMGIGITLNSQNRTASSDIYSTSPSISSDFWYISVSMISQPSGYYPGNYNFRILLNVSKDPPKIFDIVVNVSIQSVNISWKTDIPTNGSIYYGLNESYGSIIDYNNDTKHIIILDDLVPGMRYHYKIIAWNKLLIKNDTYDTTFMVPKDNKSNGGVEKPINESDSDNDGFANDIEIRFGTNIYDPASYPGSDEGQKFLMSRLNGVKISILCTTNGSITINSKIKESVPEIPEDIGKPFDFFFEITCNQSINNITLSIDFGLGNISIIPSGIDQNTVELYYFDIERNEWVEIKNSSYNNITGILSANLIHLTIFTPITTSFIPTPSEGKSEEESEENGIFSNIMILGILLMIIIIIISVFGIAYKKHKKVGRPITSQPGKIQQNVGPTTVIQAEQIPIQIYTTPTNTTISPPQGAQSNIKQTLISTPSTTSTIEPSLMKLGSEPQVAQISTTSRLTQPQPPTSKPQEPLPKTQTQLEQKIQMVPCPTCNKMIYVNTNPCSHCGIGLKW